MEYQEAVAPRFGGAQRPETVDRFPGPIAVADEKTSSGLKLEWNGFPGEDVTYAVVAEYDARGAHQLAVKTFRPSPPGQPQTSLENTVTQIVYYLDRADVIAHPDKYRYHPDRPGPVETPGKRSSTPTAFFNR